MQTPSTAGKKNVASLTENEIGSEVRSLDCCRVEKFKAIMHEHFKKEITRK